MNRVGSFEIQIVIVLPIFEDEASDSQSMGHEFCVVSLVNEIRFVKNPSVLMLNFSFDTSWG